MPDPRDQPAESPQEGEAAERVASLLADAASGGPGAEDAWREIIRLYGRRVYALAYSRCGRPDLAEEVTQSVFATVAAKLGDGYAEQGRFEAWLFRVAMNRIRDEIRRLRRHAEVTDPATFRDLPRADPEEQTEPALLARLRTAIHQLSEPDREIIELRHHGQMSFKQMADLLNEPLGTLLARHHRALRKLKQLMEAEDDRQRAEQSAADERE